MDGQLTLTIEAQLFSSAELAQILTNLDKSFRAFARARGERSVKAGLAVGAVRAGSIQILLDAIGSLGKLEEARQYLAPFASHLAHIIEIATGLQLHSSQIAAADRKAIASLASPVANGHAQQISIVNNGGVIININSTETATAILDALSAPPTARLARSEPPSVRVSITEQQVAELEQGKLVGSAFLVDDTWYARLVGGQGVLVPIKASKKAIEGLVNGGQYAFRGRPLLGDLGETV